MTNIAGEHVVASLKSKLFASTLQQPVGFFDQEGSGRLCAILNGDIGVVRQAVTETAGKLVQNVLTILGGFFNMLAVSAELTVLALAVVPVLGLLSSQVHSRVTATATEMNEISSAASAVAQECLVAIRTVKLFGRF